MQEALGIGKVASEILTVMFTDIENYTSTAAQLSREQFTKLLEIFEELSVPIIERYSGKIVKKIGDAYLVTFKSPTNAVLCGIALQRAFWYYTERYVLPYPLRIRVAIHTGEVLLKDDDVYGDAVNTAARIESVAPAGQVVFSDAVFAAMNKNEVEVVSMGLYRLKGLKYPLRLFRIRTRQDKRQKRVGVLKRVLVRAFLLAFVFGIAYAVLNFLLSAPVVT